MNNILSQTKRYTSENGGRVMILFLLFAISIVSFASYGLPTFAIVCFIPLMLILTALTFKYKMFLFCFLMIVNFFIMFANREGLLFLPVSLHAELLEVLLIAVAIIETKDIKAELFHNIMFVALIIWAIFCILEILNDSCGIGVNFFAWYTGARLMAFQLLYAFIICSIFINNPQRLYLFIGLWACLALFAVLWIWKQQELGLTLAEADFVAHSRPHIVQGRVRFFSIFSDAANCGCHMASAAIVFLICAISNKITKIRIILGIVSLLCVWCFFCTGTRTAIACFIGGLCLYVVLSKALKIMVPFGIALALFVCFLAFTDIGNNNYNIRRMRSAFNRDDASMGTRDVNKQALAKYMKDAPWGIGIGLERGDIPPYNKFNIVTSIPPDSEYVYIWVRTGKIGITLFVITTLIMLLGACYTVMFRIKNPSLSGIGAAFTCAFAAIHLGGYVNQILMQFPNVLIFYGGLAIVYALPRMEKEYSEYENKLLAKQDERRRLRLEKKRASRV